MDGLFFSLFVIAMAAAGAAVAIADYYQSIPQSSIY
jgi:NADH:ubiquinone oxidoreductase subunit K